jgi:hypothetical protein
MDMVIHWKNEESYPEILQIHGTDDRVLPAKHIENAILIEGGTHKMVVNHARILCEIIDNYLIEMVSAYPTRKHPDEKSCTPEEKSCTPDRKLCKPDGN